MDELSVGLLRRVVDYDPDSGMITWLTRGSDLFQSVSRSSDWSAAIWNSKFAGKQASSNPNSDGYCRISILGRLYLSHRVAWAVYYGEWPDADVDHINLNRFDNRICNLRLASRSENMMNTRRHSDNKSGYKGVYLDKKTGKYRSRIMRDGISRCLGRFNSAQDAHAAYTEAVVKLHGEYGRPQ